MKTNTLMTREEAKNIIQKVADGTATENQERELEAYALQEWGHPHRENTIVLLPMTPRTSGQSWYPSMRYCIERYKDIAENWCDTLHVHPFLGLAYDGNGCYCTYVYAYEHREEIEREPGGNFVKIDCWQDDHLENLVQFPCAQGKIKDVEDLDCSKVEKAYLFENIPDGCEKCNSIKNVRVVCKECLEKSIKNGDCVLETNKGE